MTTDIDAVALERPSSYLLLKRGLYWRPNRQGYTGLKCEAGRYSAEETGRFFESDGASIGPDTTRVREDRAPDIAPSCDPWIASRAALASAKPAQAGEPDPLGEGEEYLDGSWSEAATGVDPAPDRTAQAGEHAELCKQLDRKFDNICAEAASAIRTLEAERDEGAERLRWFFSDIPDNASFEEWLEIGLISAKLYLTSIGKPVLAPSATPELVRNPYELVNHVYQLPTLAERLRDEHKVKMLDAQREAEAAAGKGDRASQSLASTACERHRETYGALCRVVEDERTLVERLEDAEHELASERAARKTADGRHE